MRSFRRIAELDECRSEAFPDFFWVTEAGTESTPLDRFGFAIDTRGGAAIRVDDGEQNKEEREVLFGHPVKDDWLRVMLSHRARWKC